MSSGAVNPVEVIAELFATEGLDEHLGEAVTHDEHMRQAVWLAQQAGAPGALCAAALLHDVGHFHGMLTGRDLMSGRDNNHSETGATWLAQWFGTEVTQPVRLQVAAKRYLCAVEHDYFAKLSRASRYTLAVQGGPMDDAETRAFDALDFGADAVVPRRRDEQAKDPDAPTPSFEHFGPLLSRLLQSA